MTKKADDAAGTATAAPISITHHIVAIERAAGPDGSSVEQRSLAAAPVPPAMRLGAAGARRYDGRTSPNPARRRRTHGERQEDPTAAARSLLELQRLDVGSAVALVGHPIHVMMVHFPVAFVVATLGVDVFYWWTGDVFWLRAGLWAAGIAFWSGVAASIVGTGELLLVRGIRLLEASWSHAVAAMTLVAHRGRQLGPAPDRPGAPCCRTAWCCRCWRLGHGRASPAGMGASWCSIMASASWCRRRTDATGVTSPPGSNRCGGELVRVDVRLGQHHPQDGDDHHRVGGSSALTNETAPKRPVGENSW